MVEYIFLTNVPQMNVVTINTSVRLMMSLFDKCIYVIHIDHQNPITKLSVYVVKGGHWTLGWVVH